MDADARRGRRGCAGAASPIRREAASALRSSSAVPESMVDGWVVEGASEGDPAGRPPTGVAQWADAEIREDG